MISTQYLVRNDLLKPLSQSKVIAYQRGLQPEYKITLITYGKPKDWASKEAYLGIYTFTLQKEDC